MNDMQSFSRFIPMWSERFRVTPMRAMLFGNMLAVFFLILLSNLEVLPFRFWDFVFFSVLFFLIALFRSGFVFALLVGMLPLETVDLAPLEFGIGIRPYQFLAALLAVALVIRLVTKRARWPLFLPARIDSVLFVFLLMPLIAIPFLPFSEFASVGLRQGIILLSFGLLYFLGRVFLKKESDVRIALMFFLSSVFVVSCYAFWQNIRFRAGLPSFEVMSGRPNGTLPEADFFGGLLSMILSGMIPFGLSFFFGETVSIARKAVFVLFLFVFSLLLILSVARSGWLAAVIGMAVGAGTFFLHRGLLRALRRRDGGFFRNALSGKLFVGMPILLAIGAVLLFHLTPFDVFDRGRSVSSGLQKITVSCDRADTDLPGTIASVDELMPLGCRHILLEEIEAEKGSGHFVRETYRPDPNIDMRKNIYVESWKLAKAYPMSGIGFGNLSRFLGIDGNGRGLNASNVFLEVWIGSGIFGFILFIIFWFSFPILLLRRILRVSDDRMALLSISFLASWLALTVFNSFNSGLLLGSLWIFFAASVGGFSSFGGSTPE